ncbi:Plasmodium exported protein (PHISTa), unknown, putative [Plasmodium sp.]|nr:Plasmodium exported protein (PHISTa), unknown, putative [Plasmodium sp.]
MKCHCVEYYSGENHIKNTTKICFHKRIFSNLLTIAGILLVLVLNCIIICDKSETKNAEIYDIYRRNLSEVKCVEHSGLRGNNEKVELKNNIAFSSEGYNSKDHLKYNGVRTMKRCNNINYNDLSKQFTLEELHTVLDNLEERPSNEDFYGIWNHVLGINKEGFEDKVKYLWLYIEDYLKKYEYQFKDGASIDKIKNYIYSFIKYYDTLKLDLYNEHKNIFTERMKNPKPLEI